MKTENPLQAKLCPIQNICPAFLTLACPWNEGKIGIGILRILQQFFLQVHFHFWSRFLERKIVYQITHDCCLLANYREMALPIRLWLRILWNLRMCRRMSCTDIPKGSRLFKLFQSTPSVVSSVWPFCTTIVLNCRGLKCLVRWTRLRSGVSGEKSIALLDLEAVSFGDMQAIISSSSEAAVLCPLPAEEIDGELE